MTEPSLRILPTGPRVAAVAGVLASPRLDGGLGPPLSRQRFRERIGTGRDTDAKGRSPKWGHQESRKMNV